MQNSLIWTTLGKLLAIPNREGQNLLLFIQVKLTQLTSVGHSGFTTEGKIERGEGSWLLHKDGAEVCYEWVRDFDSWGHFLNSNGHSQVLSLVSGTLLLWDEPFLITTLEKWGLAEILCDIRPRSIAWKMTQRIPNTVLNGLCKSWEMCLGREENEEGTEVKWFIW